MTGRLMIPGVEYDFGGGRVRLIPPVSLGVLELMQERLAALPTLTATDPAAIRTVIDAAHHALRRNYPEITREEVADLVDVGNMGDVYECLMDVAGVKRKAEAAKKAMAETAQAGGATSSPESAPSPAGSGITSEST